MNYAVKLYKERDTTVNQICEFGLYYIESYRKGTVNELYQKSKLYNRN